MKTNKLALAVTLSILCLGCRVRISKARVQNPPAPKPQPILTTSLKSAIEEVKTMKVKIERDQGINLKEYDEDMTDLRNLVNQTYGDRDTVASVKSVVEGHDLALTLLQCDRTQGYDDLHQCRDKALKKIFAKYPDLAAAAQEALAGEQLSYISEGLDKEAVLQAIWQEIAKDTDIMYSSVYPSSQLISTNILPQN